MAISPQYFPGFKVTKPFFCNVTYEYNDQSGKHKLLSVAFVGNTLEYFRNDGGFPEDIENAILNNIESGLESEEEKRATTPEMWSNLKASVNY